MTDHRAQLVDVAAPVQVAAPAHVALCHISHYQYDRPIQLGAQIIRLRPAPHCRSRILDYQLTITPANHSIHWQQDPQSNYLARLLFAEKTQQLRLVVDLIAELTPLNPFDFFLESYAAQFPFVYDAEEATALAAFLQCQAASPAFSRYLATIDRSAQGSVEFLVALNQKIFKEIRYQQRFELGVQSPEETLLKGSGSCRDSSWLLVQLLRHLGLAARFVSGYLIELKEDLKQDAPAADLGELHAWCEVYLPGAGWIGLDPTSGLLAGEGHIPLACSPSPASAAPISGLIDRCECHFSHTLKIQRLK